MLQALGQPAIYEDLLDEMDQSPFAQAIIDTAMPIIFCAPRFFKFNRITDPHEHICQYQQVMLGTSMPKESKDAIMYKVFLQTSRAMPSSGSTNLTLLQSLHSRS